MTTVKHLSPWTYEMRQDDVESELVMQPRKPLPRHSSDPVHEIHRNIEGDKLDRINQMTDVLEGNTERE
jgi:hypothetical protein